MDFAKRLNDQAAAIRRLAAHLSSVNGNLLAAMTELIKRMDRRPISPLEAIDALPGRRISYSYVAEVEFDIEDEGQAGTPAVFNVSQDGPFVMTHYPMVLWRPTAPDNATNFGRWRPVTSFPLPDQVYDTDVIDLSYQLVDGGSDRNMQNLPVGPIFSRPDNMMPLPMPVLYATAAQINFIPTYNQITFDGGTPPTAGILHVALPGYKIANL